MRHLWDQIAEHLFTSAARRFIGVPEAMAGVLLAFALWCLDYARAEWPRRKGYSILLAIAGIAIAAVIIPLPDNFGSAVCCTIVAVLYYFIFRTKLGPGPAHKGACEVDV